MELNPDRFHLQHPSFRVFVDCETIAGTPEAMETEIEIDFRELEKNQKELDAAADDAEDRLAAYMAQVEKPLVKDMKAWKDAIKKAAKHQDDLDVKRVTWFDKAGLKGSAQIVCICTYTQGQLYAFTWMPLSEAGMKTLITPVGDFQGFRLAVYESEEKMLAGCAAWHDEQSISSYVGQNIFGFDLPKFRLRCGVHNVLKPYAWEPRTDIHILDTQREFGKYYSPRRDMFTSLGDICSAFQLDHSKVGDGAEVQAMYDRKEYVQIIQYCGTDCVVMEPIADRMLGPEI